MIKILEYWRKVKEETGKTEEMENKKNIEVEIEKDWSMLEGWILVCNK